MMIERCCPLVKTARVGGTSKSQEPAIQVMAKLVAKGTEKRSVRGDLLSDGGSSPNADERGLQIVIPEELHGTPFANAQRSGGKHGNWRARDSVEIGGRS